ANPGRKIELLIYRGAFPHRIELTLARRPGMRSVLDRDPGVPPAVAASPQPPLSPPTSPTVPTVPPVADGDTDHAGELARLRAENEQLRKQVSELNAQLKRTRDQLDAILRSLGSSDR
ncbi:MAG: hypothetical protein D6753_09405, partial [Planctomycetota bacterium]